MVYLETVNASAYFWYPSSHGGSGNGGLEDNVTGLPGWAMADGRGAGYGMTMWAYTGGFGGLAGFFASTVFSAAFSSLDYNRYN